METMTHIKATLYQLYRRAKLWLNYCLDRVIDLCDLVLMDAYQLPWSTAQSVAKQMARCVGDISWLLRAFPRLPAYRLIGTDWTIIFVGTEPSLKEIRAVFFEEARQQELGRIALWKLSAQSQQWLAEGTDLVVCELSRIHPNRPQAPVTFTVPTWIQQVLAIPEPLESLIAGKKFATERHRLNKAQRVGFNYRFSQCKADFDYFHYHMYLPYVKVRHGDLAAVAPYQHQWRRWFARGGLVLVTQHDEALAGVLCYKPNDTCFDVERGVLAANPRLFKQGIETMITWYAINWACDQGAQIYDMGGAHAWHSNGAFNTKRRWGAHVMRRRRIYGTWTFLARNGSSSLLDHMNEVGFISEIDGKFYEVLLCTDATPVTETDLDEELLAVKTRGLDGLVVVSPNSKPAIYEAV
jgi:hypothetical protein